MKTKMTDKAEITYALINNVSGNRKTETRRNCLTASYSSHERRCWSEEIG